MMLLAVLVGSLCLAWPGLAYAGYHASFGILF